MAMVTVNKLPEFHRSFNGISIRLRMDDWPEDVPLPENTRMAKLGDAPSSMIRNFYLLPDKTVDHVVCLFVLPFSSLEEAIAWYRDTMRALGWVEIEEGGYREGARARLFFRHPEEEVRVEVRLQYWKYIPEVRAMISRVSMSPWPAEGETLPPETADLSRPVHEEAHV